MLNNDTLLYQVEQIRLLEKQAAKKFKIGVDVLMQRAGKSAFLELKNQWPKAKNIVVACGKGNNGGDGYIVAYLAKKAKLNVKILQLVPYENLSGAAKQAAYKCKQLKIKTLPFNAKELSGSDLIVDAILGTGLVGKVSSKFKIVINAINKLRVPVLALDVPSGIDADTGRVLGAAICATVTVTFIGLKIGLLVGQARNYCGKIIAKDLSLPKEIFRSVDAYAKKLVLEEEIKSLVPRKPNAHKGDFGHVLIIGGDYGMAGAVRMAAESALRIGAGLVSVATRPKNALMINAVCPEIMAYGVTSWKKFRNLLARASVVVIGPGLGTSNWSKSWFAATLKYLMAHNATNRVLIKPLLVDADALNLLASNFKGNKKFKNFMKYKESWILTPHPGEAARLLGVTNQEIQLDRLQALQKIQNAFAGVCVLKGAGTLVATAGEKIRLCNAGNPGMASAGMGDVLSGMIAGLLAQGLSLFDAAKLGVLVHAMAGDLVAAKKGKLGILALDLVPEARNIINLQLK